MIDIASVRHELGSRYGLGRPLYMTELARLIGLADGKGNLIDKLEHGRARLSGPVEVVIRMLLDGHRSPRHDQALKPEVQGARGRRFDLAKA